MNQAKAIKYLLRDLPENELIEVEERSFRDAELSDLLSEAEDDLIDAYVRDELSEGERKRFERRFLVSERRLEKVGIARALLAMEAASPSAEREEEPGKTGWWNSFVASLQVPRTALSYGLAAAALFFLLAGLWLFSEVRALRNEAARLAESHAAGERRAAELEKLADDERLRSEALQKENETLGQQVARLENEIRALGPEPSLLTVFLTTGFRTAEGPQKVSIPAAIRNVRIKLKLNPADDYPVYRADLQTSVGKPIRHWSRLRSSFVDGERTMIVDVPARLLSQGSYELTVKGVGTGGNTESLGYYYFNVTDKR